MRGAYGTRIQTQLYLIIVPPDGHQGCHCGETACLYSITWGVGREAQEGSELPARRSRLLRRLSYLILCSEVFTLRIELWLFRLPRKGWENTSAGSCRVF